MIKVDEKIEFKIEGLNNKNSQLSTSIFLYHFAEIITFILALVTSIIVLKYFSNENRLYIGMFIFLFIWILNIHYIFLLNETIDLKKEQQIKIKDDIEYLKDFSTYLLAYRHLESIKNGNNLYPELRENDSKYIVNEYKNYFEKVRIRYENEKIIEL